MSCLFCQIVAGDVPATIVADNEHSVAFRDIDPQAPTHILVVPREHHETIGAAAAADPAAAAALLNDIQAVAESAGAGDAYRLVFNSGAETGQTVFHCHGHILAGRTFDWPPG